MTHKTRLRYIAFHFSDMMHIGYRGYRFIDISHIPHMNSFIMDFIRFYISFIHNMILYSCMNNKNNILEVGKNVS